MPLTPRQLEVLDYVTQFVRDHRYAPTLREMADEFDISRVTVLQHLEALEEKGYLERQPNKARGITVKKTVRRTPDTEERTGTPSAVRDRVGSERYGATEAAGTPEEETFPYVLPLNGYVTAGGAVTSLEEPKVLPVNEVLADPDACYLLEVRGDAYTDEHILNGDYLVVDEDQNAQNDQLVVLGRDDGPSVIGRYRREDEDVRIQTLSSSSGPESFSPDPDNVEFLGTVVGLLRSM